VQGLLQFVKTEYRNKANEPFLPNRFKVEKNHSFFLYTYNSLKNQKKYGGTNSMDLVPGPIGRVVETGCSYEKMNRQQERHGFHLLRYKCTSMQQ